MQEQNQMIGIFLMNPGFAATEKAKTLPFPMRTKVVLRKTKKNHTCHLSEGTIWQGPTFMNFAMPTDAEKTDMLRVIQYINI